MIEILEPATDVVAQVTENPALAILNEEKFEAFYEKLKAEAAKVSGDVSTNKARDEVRSMAFKIAKTRTAIDKARLGLTEEWRTKTAQANTAGKAIKERLEALEESVRKPLTDWEQAEAERVKAHTDLMTAITKAEFVGIEDTAESVAERIEWLDGLLIDPDVHLEKLDFVQGAKDAAIEKLTVQHMRLVREES
jgi:colicin import membrane protein